MVESLIADAWLEDVLTGDATLAAAVPGGWHADVAPEETDSPWGVWFQVSGVDVGNVGNGRIMADLVYEVRVTGRNCGYGALKAAADRMDGLLHKVKGVTLADGKMIGCERVEPVRFSEQDGAQVYRHLGGRYRVLTQA
jgi:hypothetical protein